CGVSPVPLLPQESRAFHSNQHCAQNQQCALTQPIKKKKCSYFKNKSKELPEKASLEISSPGLLFYAYVLYFGNQ
ncbi:hypothetical protein ACFVSW_27220, partial [Neobacillus sp. NPDC058068]|uniref:hypothetical protein n=1 Tax=Neobacillus sp. NPDC058068 TaxID=3346325 RepID=UPI0036DBA0F1